MDDGKSAGELRRLGYLKATVWIVDHKNQRATELWRERARLAADSDGRDHSDKSAPICLMRC